MKPDLIPIRWQLLDTAEAVAREACQRILTTAQRAIIARGCFRLALAGGRTPLRTYSLLKQSNPDWARWHIYYADERCLPEHDTRRNNVAVKLTLWENDHPLPDHHHFIPAYSSEAAAIQQAADDYANLLKEVLPFDLVLLGIGEDGHVASLFPGQVHPSGELVHAIFNSPKSPPERVSLSIEALCNTRDLLILVTGKEKREAVVAWRRGELLPVTQICRQVPVGAEVLIDRAAEGRNNPYCAPEWRISTGA
jgi:6-phosphogluconolactonase